MSFTNARWRLEAACIDENPSMFEHGPYAEAKEICRRCSVRDECLDYALEGNIAWGLWGGLNPSERRTLSRGLRKFLQENHMPKKEQLQGGTGLPNAS